MPSKKLNLIMPDKVHELVMDFESINIGYWYLHECKSYLLFFCSEARSQKLTLYISRSSVLHTQGALEVIVWGQSCVRTLCKCSKWPDLRPQ